MDTKLDCDFEFISSHLVHMYKCLDNCIHEKMHLILLTYRIGLQEPSSHVDFPTKMAVCVCVCVCVISLPLQIAHKEHRLEHVTGVACTYGQNLNHRSSSYLPVDTFGIHSYQTAQDPWVQLLGRRRVLASESGENR